MNKRKIKINFADHWSCLDPEKDKFAQLLRKHFDVELSDTPEYLIDGGYGHDHLKYNCIKIALICENVVPDFNFFDYAVGFDYLEFGDRYLRVPLYDFNEEYYDLAKRNEPPPREALLNRKFCSFVVSNGGGADPVREEFFHRLSKYKQVDSGGRYLNNVGGPVPDKNAFCRQYKFNIAFENSSSPGYTTEKIMQPLTYFTIPIYFGNPLIEREFVPDCMVRVHGMDDIDRAIDEIIQLDKNDDEYIRRATIPCQVNPVDYYDKQLEEFLVHIVEQPYEQARRLNRYGYQAGLHKRQRRFARMDRILAGPVKFLGKCKRWVGL